MIEEKERILAEEETKKERKGKGLMQRKDGRMKERRVEWKEVWKRERINERIIIKVGIKLNLQQTGNINRCKWNIESWIRNPNQTF